MKHSYTAYFYTKNYWIIDQLKKHNKHILYTLDDVYKLNKKTDTLHILFDDQDDVSFQVLQKNIKNNMFAIHQIENKYIYLIRNKQKQSSKISHGQITLQYYANTKIEVLFEQDFQNKFLQ